MPERQVAQAPAAFVPMQLPAKTAATDNHKRVARVMKAQGMGIKPRRRFVRTTDSKHNSPIFPNLYRNVIPTRPNVVWVADFTYIRIASGFCYLAAILDACSRKVVGYAISRNIDTTLVSVRPSDP